MSLVSGKTILEKAKREKRAVGAFNFTSLEQLKAIVSACKKLNTEAFLSVSESAIGFLGIENVVSMTKNETKNTNINFALHLDHGKSFKMCKTCVEAGFTSVMIDASKLCFDENVKLTKKVCDFAHSYGVSVEGELGKIEGVEDNTLSRESVLTNPNDAQNFINLTGVDSLAISIGTSHGAYKFKGESVLDIKRLKEINEKTNGFLLVLHGASSVNKELVENFSKVGGDLDSAKGVSDEMIVSAIENGICKINVDTDNRIAFTTGVRQSLQNPSVFSPREYLLQGICEMQKEVEKRINIFNNFCQNK